MGTTVDARPGPAAGLAGTLRIGCVSLVVRDLSRTASFYREAIGLQVVEQEAGLVRLGAGGRAFLELLGHPGALPDDPGAAGLFHTAFLLPSRTCLGRWLRHLAGLGVALDGASDHGVSEAVYLHDPEGNGIEVYADRPRASWRWSGGQVEMTTERLDIQALMRDAGDAAWTGAPAETRIGHVHLRVGDVGEAVRFYGGALGLDVVCQRPGAAFLSTGGYHHHIAVNTWSSAGAGPRDPGRAGLASVAFEAADAGVLGSITRAADGLADPWGIVFRFHIAP